MQGGEIPGSISMEVSRDDWSSPTFPDPTLKTSACCWSSYPTHLEDPEAAAGDPHPAHLEDLHLAAGDPHPTHLEDLHVAAGDVLPGVVLPGDAEDAAGMVDPAQPRVPPAVDGAQQPLSEPQLLGFPAGARASPGEPGPPAEGDPGLWAPLPLLVRRCHGAGPAEPCAVPCRARTRAREAVAPCPILYSPLSFSWKSRVPSESESVAAPGSGRGCSGPGDAAARPSTASPEYQ